MYTRTTKKAIKERFSIIYNVGYCNLQNLLAYSSVYAYSTRVEGWACDYYVLAGGVVICTGYSCIGQKVDYNTLRKWDNKAKDIFKQSLGYTAERDAINELLYEFIEELDTNASKGIMAI